MTRSRKGIAISLCFGLTLSGFATLSAGAATEWTGGETSGNLVRFVPAASPERPKTETLTAKTSVQEFRTGKIRMTDRNVRRITAKDVEAFMKAGHGMFDIAQAEALAGQYRVSMEELLAAKAGGRSWDEIKRRLEEDRIRQELEKYRQRYPEAWDGLRAEKLSEQQALEVLELYADYRGVADVKEIAALYRKLGREAAESELMVRADRVRIPKERLARHGLTEADVAGLSIVVFNRLETMAEERGEALGDMLRQTRRPIRTPKGE